MSKSSISTIIRGVRTAAFEHKGEILTGFGVAGMIFTTVLAVKATPKALQLIEEEKQRQNHKLLQEANENGDDAYSPVEKLKPLDVVKTTWKCYVPAAITCVASASCLIGASSVHMKRNAALATAYKLSENALSEYRDKVVETIGEKKEMAVRDKVAKEQIEKTPVVNSEVVFTGRGETMCYDPITSRYFRSDIENIRRVVNELNRRMLDEMYISLNEFYLELDLNPADVGEEMGWNINRGLIDIHFSAQLAENDQPCLVIDHLNPPKYGFAKM